MSELEVEPRMSDSKPWILSISTCSSLLHGPSFGIVEPCTLCTNSAGPSVLGPPEGAERPGGPFSISWTHHIDIFKMRIFIDFVG